MTKEIKELQDKLEECCVQANLNQSMIDGLRVEYRHNVAVGRDNAEVNEKIADLKFENVKLDKVIDFLIAELSVANRFTPVANVR